ncbi:MAG: DUF4091 domain-containing protein [Clostridia bacterium]|nr:DUF4091 domain-containing protein [Clostridia bacterium]
MFKFKAISALEKVMLTDTYDKYEEITCVKGLKGERVSFQIQIGHKPTDPKPASGVTYYTLRSPLRKQTQVSRVGYIPSELPAYRSSHDDDYISIEPGLFPDVMYPLTSKDKFYILTGAPTTLMVTVDIPKDIEAGEYPLYFCFHIEKGKPRTPEKRSLKITVKVEDAVMKENDLIFGQWFHCDCISNYHKVKVFSKKFWKITENYIKTAARTGMNTILTPIFTPPLDTQINGERKTVQLVKIQKTGDKYSFNFDLLEKWVDMCQRHGFKYFEMAHLFTQWGAKFCPKIIVEIDGKQVKEFGWHVEAMSNAYKNFLSQFLPALTAKLKDLGIAENTYFHISDEPNDNFLENYKAAKEFVAPLLKDFKIIDALSSIEFYKKGLVDIPIPCNDHIAPFLEEDIDERWTYYCCVQTIDVSNRFFAMPGYRNRCMGLQMFRNDISGFMTWGFNFYSSAQSVLEIDPYLCSDSIHAHPSGDAYSVYPYGDGAIESIRTVVFHQAMQDRMLLKMLAEKIDLEETKKWLDEEAGMVMDFKHYPKNSKFYDEFHDKIIDRLIK